MGNEGSRAIGDGLSPLGSPGVPASPRTPTSVRRAKSFSTTGATNGDAASKHNSAVDRNIQRMDKTIRKRVRGGITYNMKIILRGDRGTGKTSLFQRLKGEPIPNTHEPTPQLQSATINWSFRANSEESIKCDVWDVVDKGFSPGSAPGETTTSANGADVNPFEAGALQPQQNGAHAVANVDATTVDVYHETHGVVFLLDVTKPHTLEYVRQQLDTVPVHIPTLVLGNFRDLGGQRKIFKEDIQQLLYGGGVTHHQPLRRPQELLYFECSLLNCYGLKSLHQYFGIPFLQLKQQTIRQQLRILEGEFTHLKHDLQAKISEHKYADYLDHIKASGSDIRTGRRAAAAVAAAAATATATAGSASATTASPVLSNGEHEEEDSPKSKHRLDRTMSSSSDIVVHGESTRPVPEPPSPPSQTLARQVDLEDLPARTAALDQPGNSLKIDYTEAERRAAVRQPEMPPLPGMSATSLTLNGIEQEETSSDPANRQDKRDDHARQSAKPARKPTAVDLGLPSNDAPMNLEDFQVPKPRHNDLDSFYSDDDSEDEAANGGDDDVVITGRGSKSASAKYHKQKFLDSDDSDSGSDSEKKRNASTTSTAQGRSPRRQITKPSSEEPVSSVANAIVMPPLPVPFRPSTASHRPSSPPRPSVSPQHSPRRRVKETLVQTFQEPVDTSIDQGVQSSTTSGVETVGSPRAIVAHSLDKNVSTASPTAASNGIPEPASVHGTSIEEASTEPIPAAAANEPSPAKDRDGTAEQPPAIVSEQEPSTEESAIGTPDEVGSIDAASLLPAATETVEEEEDLVAPVSGGEIDSFFSDEDDREEDKALESVGESSHMLAPSEEEATSVALQDEPETMAVREASAEAIVPQASPFEVTSSATTTPVAAKAESEEEFKKPRSVGLVAQLKQQLQQTHVELRMTDDDADENESTPTISAAMQLKPAPATVAKAAASSRSRKVEIEMSDDEDSDGDRPVPPPRSQFQKLQPFVSDTSSFPSPPIAPAVVDGSGNLGDMLEAFLNDSDSDSDADNRALKPAISRTSTKPAIDDDDSEEGSANDRFAAYDKKRSSTSRRKVHAARGDSTPFLTTSSFATSTLDDTITSSNSIANLDVLAAIRQAEQDALRMLETPTPTATQVAGVGTASGTGERIKPKKKTSGLSSSSRRKKDAEAGDEDSKPQKTKKKKAPDGGSSSSSRTKRREVILTDGE